MATNKESKTDGHTYGVTGLAAGGGIDGDGRGRAGSHATAGCCGGVVNE